MKNSIPLSDLVKARFFGLDAHQKTIVIAEAPSFGDPCYVATLDHSPKAVQRFFADVCEEGVPIFTVYEAGGCGFGLARQLADMGILNLVAAPSKITKASGEIKNDKRDAIKLARLLRTHVLMGQKELHDVHVPECDDEAIREKTRQRNAFKRQAKVTQNQIMGMLRRHRIRYSLTKQAWTKTYRAWLERVDFGNALLQDVFREFLDQLHDLEARVAKCDRELDRICESWNRAQVVSALCALKGIQQLSAVSIVAEIGSFSRFETAPKLMGYLGLVPSESSSGEKVTRGRITKTGNKRVRTLLVEVACSARYKPKSKAAFLKTCPKGLPPEVLDHAYKAQIRLHRTYWKLVQQGKNRNTARTAVARELVGFIWWIGLIMETIIDAQFAEAA